jgi:hypothetical protein
MMSDTPASPNASWKRRHWKLLTLVIVLLAPLLIGGGWAALAFGFSYSKGERAGYVQKISKRGWVCKTWEGELAMANLPGSMPQIFTFTVHNDSIARLIENNLGKQVSLTYEEHRGVPTSCFGETKYWITNMRTVKP